MAEKYDDLSKGELIALLEARERRDATRFGLVWEANEVERDRATNSDFVALDLIAADSTGRAPWRNLVIEGDNFDALRYLRMTHAGRIKCIYIDPPYNTGNRDFVYNDRFVDAEDSWRHSTWVEFMYQRLLVARELLTQDGVIFVSIDDNEVFALGLLLKKVFGQKSFVANCIWQKRYSRENRESIGDAHEYILVFAPHPELFKETRGRIPLTEQQAKIYKNPNNDPKGRWRAIPMSAQGYRPNQMYNITTPSGVVHPPPEGRCWSMLESEFLKLKSEGRVWFGKNGDAQPGIIRYLSEVEGFVPWTWWPHDEAGHTDEARKEIREWLDTQTAFQTPKPLRLMERILRIGCGPEDIILDFFAGSGTTAHAVLKMNAEDGGNRRFILVSSTEATTDDPKKNICRDVCAKRVRRAIEGYSGNPGLGGDFAYLRCSRIKAGQLVEIEHHQVWIALQLIHKESLKPFTEAEFLVSGDSEMALIYVPRFSSTIVPGLREAVEKSAEVVLYSWQPELLRQHIGSSNIEHAAIPESLVRRFGIRGVSS